MSRETQSVGPGASEPPQPPETFARIIAGARVPLSSEASELLARYLAELDAWRRRINLTGRLSPEELVAHALESVSAAVLISDGQEVVDIGSGSGFPAIPLAILKPDATFALFEPTAKKAAFLRHVGRCLTLSNVVVHAARAGDIPGETFDVATTRAVGSLGAHLGAATFLRPAGRLLAWTTDAQALARELPALRLAKELPIAGSRAKVIAVFERR